MANGFSLVPHLSVAEVWQHTAGILQALSPKSCGSGTDPQTTLCRQLIADGPYGPYWTGRATEASPCPLGTSPAFDAVIRTAQVDKVVRAQIAMLGIPGLALYTNCRTLPRGATTSEGVPGADFRTAQAMRRSGDLATWGPPNLQLIKTITWVIKYGNPETRLELLSALGQVPIPLSWIPVIKTELKNAAELLPEVAADQRTRQALAKSVRETEGRIDAVIADQAMGRLPTIDLPGIGPAVPAVQRDWKPYAIAGGVAVGLLGVLFLVLRRR